MRLKKGFTIVEVSLVVAIGGLILVGALIAVPNLLRTSRDAQRKTDMETLVSAIKKYQTNNNRGALPVSTASEWVEFMHSFLSNFIDPDGNNYQPNPYSCYNITTPDTTCNDIRNVFGGGGKQDFSSNVTFPNGHKMFVVIGAKCGDDNKPVKSSSDRKFAVIYVLEVNDLFCIDG